MIQRGNRMNMNLPDVIDCNVGQCAYNQESKCHSGAINIGNREPVCDTYVEAEIKGGFQKSLTKIGACKMSDCRFNGNYECLSAGIKVGAVNRHALCMNFKVR